jgi:uncharacterized membrane protein
MMIDTGYELIFFFFVYAFIGWCTETACLAILKGRFYNRGFLNLPFSLSGGFAMVLILIAVETLKGEYLWQAIAYLVITAVCFHTAGDLSARLTGTKLWNYQVTSLISSHWNYGILLNLSLAVYCMLLKVFVHPFVYVLSQLFYPTVLKVLDGTLILLTIADLCLVLYSIHKKPLSGAAQHFEKNLQERKKGIGNRISDVVWRRLRKAYPNLTDISSVMEKNQKTYTFAKGMCLYKLMWVFLISSLIGDLIETVYVHMQTGIWMSRSSVIYGPFSVVWGIGTTLMTFLLYRLSDRHDRYIFVWGFLIGGTYEYMASLILELVLGTKFWDYSKMPFNLHGRTNLMFCMFWGLLALVWIKFCYPILSRLIERIPPLPGVIITWILVILMVCDLAISGLAINRYVDRNTGIPAKNSIESFWDRQYPDELIEFIWPNLRIQKS